jgi:hypothetical protein
VVLYAVVIAPVLQQVFPPPVLPAVSAMAGAVADVTQRELLIFCRSGAVCVCMCVSHIASSCFG